MIPELRILDFEFLQEISKKEKTLTQIKDNMDKGYWGMPLAAFQKILAKLENIRFVKSERRGRQRFVKITKDGKYFLNWYQKNKKTIGTNRRKG